MTKKILGLDLGTNSIGWAVIHKNDEDFWPSGIEVAGSRIIPMSEDVLGNFDAGNSISQTADRTGFRGTRRLRERYLLRRSRLIRVLDFMKFLPEHFSAFIDRYGNFEEHSEPKLAWYKDEMGKNQFLFMSSFYEMIEDFRKTQPELIKDGKLIPLDWTIYYLRKKALTQAISKEELAWILLNFNQKRGYYQLRGEDEDIPQNKNVEYHILKVVKVESTDQKKGDATWYKIFFENGWIYSRTSKYPLDLVGKELELIVTTELNDEGKPKLDKEGNVKRSFRAPSEDDWTLLKTKTEHNIINSQETVGAYIYDHLIKNPRLKIIGQLVRTIERKFYKQELTQILNKQKEFIPELNDRELYQKCLEILYEHNEAHRNNNENKGFTYLFVDDIIFYQRPLKSKKSLISNCPYEYYEYLNPKTQQKEKQYLKCIAKSHPLFQEFRLWQFVQNIKIFQKEAIVEGKLKTDVDVTGQFLKSTNDYVMLFDWLNTKKEVEQKDFLKYPIFGLKKEYTNFRWNYVEDKKYPCNETHYLILSRLEKSGVSVDFLTSDKELELWHVLYSIEDKYEIEKALKKYADKNHLPDEFVVQFSKFPPFKKEYGSYSAKAIKKLLPLMRMGKYWDESNFDGITIDRINKLITGESDDSIKTRVREKAINLTEICHFQGLPLWLACYIVYGRHSEAQETSKWEKWEDVDDYIKTFKQYSLRNPIVEQVVLETLRTVRDIWRQTEQIDEIHLELGREMKNPADKRKKMTESILNNENANLRIKAMLMEFQKPEYGIEGVRPYSPNQQDILRIYEEFALDNLSKDDKDFDFVSKISKMSQPTVSDIQRYRLWLEQRYRSPYTGEIIPLAKLFTHEYQIEHVIPQSRYFDDSFSNKIICEAEVNQEKDKMLGYEFISHRGGEIINLSSNKQVRVFTVEEYEQFVKDHYTGIKKKKLLMEDIPEEFIERQLNDSRYISKFVLHLLSKIVREKDEDAAISKNVIVCNGSVTSRLKKDWGLNDVWNRIVLPRFIRLNELTNNDKNLNLFTTYNQQGELIPEMPLELQKGFNKKRIDHRHHAMDAIVIACATREHVNLLNNEAAKPNNQQNRYQLSHKLRRTEDVTIKKGEDCKKINIFKEFYLPWKTFPQDVYDVLKDIVVSFKQNQRIINKTLNSFESYKDESGQLRLDGNDKPKKGMRKQTKGNNWAIRKSMHKDTVFGEVNLRMTKEVGLSVAISNHDKIVNKDFKIKIKELLHQGCDAKRIKKYLEDNKDVWSDINPNKISIYYFTKETNDRFFATRKLLDTSFDRKKIEESVTDTGIQKILLRHLENSDNDPEIAFSPEGIEKMNDNILELNNGHFHQPIKKVRWYEKGDKFAVGQIGNKSAKFVEAAKGTNLFFAVYADEKGKRSFETIPLNKAIERQKMGLISAPEQNEKGDKLLFILSPNDLVYLPTEEQRKNGIHTIDKERIYKMVSCTGNTCFFINNVIAKSIVNKMEFSALNKMERAITGEMIKEVCVPINVDRIGRVHVNQTK